jgi:hypothetical protein
MPCCGAGVGKRKAKPSKDKYVNSYDSRFIELNFEPMVLSLQSFISFGRRAFDKTYAALLQRDNGCNTLGPSGMSDRHKEVKVCVSMYGCRAAPCTTMAAVRG